MNIKTVILMVSSQVDRQEKMEKRLKRGFLEIEDLRSFMFIILLKNSMMKKFGSQNMTVLCLNPCYNEMCYKGTVLKWIYSTVKPM